jgi:hypothetical protein
MAFESAAAGQIKMPFEIHGEIAVSNGPLKDWITGGSVKSALVLDEEVDGGLVDTVLDKGYGGSLTDNDLEKIGQDAFLVAYALVDSQRVVVTKENSKPSAKKGNRKLPDVCNDLAVKWTRDFELYRLLNFSTARNRK